MAEKQPVVRVNKSTVKMAEMFRSMVNLLAIDVPTRLTL